MEQDDNIAQIKETPLIFSRNASGNATTQRLFKSKPPPIINNRTRHHHFI
jgi:hypothetical protein